MASVYRCQRGRYVLCPRWVPSRGMIRNNILPNNGWPCACCMQEFTLSFESVSALVVKYLSPVEELSPFKLGNIQKLISDIAEAAG